MPFLSSVARCPHVTYFSVWELQTPLKAVQIVPFPTEVPAHEWGSGGTLSLLVSSQGPGVGRGEYPPLPDDFEMMIGGLGSSAVKSAAAMFI